MQNWFSFKKQIFRVALGSLNRKNWKKKLNINYRDFLCTSSPTHKTGVVHTRMRAHTHTPPPLSTSPTINIPHYQHPPTINIPTTNIPHDQHPPRSASPLSTSPISTSPHYQHPPLSLVSAPEWYFVTINDHTLTHHYYLESIGYLSVYSWCYIFHGFGQIYNSIFIIKISQRLSFIALKILSALPICNYFLCFNF